MDLMFLLMVPQLSDSSHQLRRSWYVDTPQEGAAGSQGRLLESDMQRTDLLQL